MATERPAVTRRTFLRTAGVAGLAGLAGCAGRGESDGTEGNGDSITTSQTSTRFTTPTHPSDYDHGQGRSMTVALLSSGSLNNALLTDFKATVNVPVRVESHGSAEVARLIDEGLRDPDIVALADTALFNQPLTPPWYSVFTSNAVVIAINKNTKWGQRVAEAGKDGWYKPMIDGNVKLGRTPPDQDPLGYRALFMLELASRYYENTKPLRKKILKRGQMYPETGLLSRIETGALDAAIVYRNMAVERGYEYIDLPDQIDLSNPKYVEKWYSSVSYSLPGKTIHGDLITYGATIRHMSNAALNVFDVLTTGSYLSKHGFILREQFPTYRGSVPKRVKQVSKSDTRSRAHASTLSPDISDITVLI
jgi:molybdate/tungstate transport system substrate-binding protein